MWRADPPAASSRSQRAVESSKGVAETAVAAAERSPNGSGDPQSTSARPLLVGDATPDTAPNSSPTVRAGEQTRVVQARPSVDRSTVIRELRSKDSLSPTGSTAVPMKRTNLLEDELSLIQAASGALDAGDARDAMRTLEMHRRRFATGFLTEEREGLWIVALCQAGRVPEAAAARAEFERHAPRSPLRRRIETQCKAAAKALGDPSTSERPE
jgi:hypothetical protein